ncbi:MAG: hypothetical protein JJE02_10480 [Propionibacteriales bacterium]|nr:hypothetical protein [Propionibacteriales bacterium]
MNEPNPNAISTETGDAKIDAALAHLIHLGELPVEKHPAVFDAVHAELRAALTNAGGDEEPAEAP